MLLVIVPFLRVRQGRGGRGSIYVWASGDGGSYDDCNCDGYASSMWTISINSAINDGRTALYDESCSSTLASTFSNGRKRNPEAGVVSVCVCVCVCVGVSYRFCLFEVGAPTRSLKKITCKTQTKPFSTPNYVLIITIFKSTMLYISFLL